MDFLGCRYNFVGGSCPVKVCLFHWGYNRGAMLNELELRATLIMLAQAQQEAHKLIYALMAELASVRETVRGLDPTFADVLESRRKYFADQTSSALKQSQDAFDEIVRRLNTGVVC